MLEVTPAQSVGLGYAVVNWRLILAARASRLTLSRAEPAAEAASLFSSAAFLSAAAASLALVCWTA